MPKKGDLRVWNVINPPAEPTLYAVNSPKEAKGIIKMLADGQLANKHIYANAFGLVEWDDEMQEWQERYDEDGFDINEAEL